MLTWQWDSDVGRRFHVERVRAGQARYAYLLGKGGISQPECSVKFDKAMVELDCAAVRRELVNWMEGELSAELRARINLHLKSCEHCTAVYDGTRNVVELVGSENAIELPPGLSRRLYRRLARRHQ